MNLIDDAGKVWHKLWSVRLAAAAAVLSALDAGVSYYLTGTPPLLAIGGAILSLCAGVARVVAQPALRQ